MYRNFKIIPYILLSLGVFSALSMAAEKLSLTPEKAIELSLQNSKRLHGSLMKTVAADAKAKEANAGLLPKLTGGASYTRLSEVPAFEITPPGSPSSIVISDAILNNYNFKLGLQQPIFTGFRIKSNADLQKFFAEAVKQDYTKDRSELVFAVKSAYWNLYKANEFKSVIDDNVLKVESHLKDVQNLQTQGLVTNNEVLTVQVQLSNVKLLQIDAKDNVKLAMIYLNNLMGISLDTEIDLTSDASMISNQVKVETGTVDSYISNAMSNRAELKAMSSRLKASNSGVKLAKSAWYPQVYLGANYYYARPNARILPSKDEFEDTWDVGVSATIDIWNWGATAHQTKQARAQLSQTEDAMGELKDGIALEVTSDYLNLNEAKDKISVATQGVAQAEESYRMTREKFKAGLSPNSELLDAENALLTAKWNYTQAVVDYELAQAKLQKSSGQN